MEKFKFVKKESVSMLPKGCGIYVFRKGRQSLYIGKAVNIGKRVKSYFKKSSFKSNIFIDKVSKIGFIETNSEIEALILEASLIKKHKPKHNIIWRDDKNFFYVGITKEELPRVFLTHQIKEQKTENRKQIKYIGPFVSGAALKKTLRTLRRTFPYYSTGKHPKTPCSWCQLGLCPGPNPDKIKYQKNIKSLIRVLEGKSSQVLESLKKQMRISSQLQDFERAAQVRDQIISLERILSHARVLERLRVEEKTWKKTEKELKKILKTEKRIMRIEAYDISNIQGQRAGGSMVVFTKGAPDKSSYRKFRIKMTKGPDDVAMIKEVLERRFEHVEWGLPDVILIDGGKAQLNAGIYVKNRKQRTANIKVISLAKKENKLYIEGRKGYLSLKRLPREIFNLILQLRDEAHRFAITYHKKLRKKGLFA